jgi:hypothetical protein
MECSKPKELPTLALPLDTRSPAGSAGKRVWALVLNAQADISGRMLRLAGWRRFGWEAIALGTFVNQDFHDQLQETASEIPTCDVPTEVVISQTGSSSDGSVSLGIQHDGATPSRVRWYKDDVLVYDSQA